MKSTTWIFYSLAFFMLPAILGLIGAFGFGKSGALLGICLGLAAIFASVGWTLRR